MNTQNSVEISERVRKAMENDIAYYPDEVETGGFLLGYTDSENDRTEVIEAVDGGYNARREATLFAYDAEYVEHVASLTASLYEPFLEVVGVWHKHNHYHEEDEFSQDDMKLHEEVMRCSGKNKIVSILYQKKGDEYIVSGYIFSRGGGGELVGRQVDTKSRRR